jgi:hypothetical protein
VQNDTADPIDNSTAEADTTGNMSLPTDQSRDTLAEEILRPITAQLQKLASTNAPRIPPPGPLKGKTHIQLVKARVLPIGEFIVEYLNTMEESQRGAMDMRFWSVPYDLAVSLHVKLMLP